MNLESDLPQQAPRINLQKAIIIVSAFFMTAVAAGTAGYVLGARASQPMSSPATINTFSPAPATESAQQAAISNWATYTNRELGFTIQYPRDLYSSPLLKGVGQGWVSLLPAQNYRITIATDDGAKYLPFYDPKELFGKGPLIAYDPKELDRVGASVNEILLDGVKAYRLDHCCTTAEPTEIDIIAIKDGSLYEIRVTPMFGSPTKVSSENLKLVEEIINTFKFVR